MKPWFVTLLCMGSKLGVNISGSGRRMLGSRSLVYTGMYTRDTYLKDIHRE
jgi:hypothetical protein